MLNVLTKYSTMVTDGSTGSTSYVPMMPRAEGFCITTHKRTQEARKQLFLLVYFNRAPLCALRAVTNAKRKIAAQRENLLYYQARCFLVAIPSGSSTQATKKSAVLAWR